MTAISVQATRFHVDGGKKDPAKRSNRALQRSHQGKPFWCWSGLIILLSSLFIYVVTDSLQIISTTESNRLIGGLLDIILLLFPNLSLSVRLYVDYASHVSRDVFSRVLVDLSGSDSSQHRLSLYHIPPSICIPW
jgi:hypothetical protein